MVKRIVIDASLCDGCLNCSVACMNAGRETPGSVYELDLEDPENSSRNCIYQREGNYFPVFCRHCEEPDCLRACMSGALRKNAQTGLVEYNPERCSGCYMCVMNCRFGHPKPDWRNRLVIRCTFCQDTKEGEPQCVKACPKKAIMVREVEK
ncbi:MAG: 4Fe-4S dicluster domain-containing protein [Clostridium sp.]|nr:4Fe-4S dicluster domain-containing protein [Clostridium sp.]